MVRHRTRCGWRARSELSSLTVLVTRANVARVESPPGCGRLDMPRRELSCAQGDLDSGDTGSQPHDASCISAYHVAEVVDAEVESREPDRKNQRRTDELNLTTGS